MMSNTSSGNAAVIAAQQQRAVAELTAGLVTVLALRAGGVLRVTMEELNAAAGVAVNIETVPTPDSATIVVTVSLPTADEAQTTTPSRRRPITGSVPRIVS